jgi:hypothetical protein
MYSSESSVKKYFNCSTVAAIRIVNSYFDGLIKPVPFIIYSRWNLSKG